MEDGIVCWCGCYALNIFAKHSRSVFSIGDTFFKHSRFGRSIGDKYAYINEFFVIQKLRNLKNQVPVTRFFLSNDIFVIHAMKAMNGFSGSYIKTVSDEIGIATSYERLCAEGVRLNDVHERNVVVRTNKAQLFLGFIDFKYASFDGKLLFEPRTNNEIDHFNLVLASLKTKYPFPKEPESFARFCSHLV